MQVPAVNTDVAQLVEDAQSGDITAVARLKQFAKEGNLLAQYKLGVLYNFGCRNGRGIPRNAELAVHWFSMAAEQRHYDSESRLSLMYQNGRGVAKNKKKLLFWLQQAIRDNPRNALYANGRLLPPVITDGHPTYNYPEAIAAIARTRKMAAQGEASSQNDLGRMYENGTGVQQDIAQAVKWFQMAANQNYAPAERNLGVLYLAGVGVPKNYYKARALFFKAAQQRDGIAAYDLGRLYYSGSGVPRDFGQAARWYQASAEDGFDAGQFTTAMWFAEGRGVPQDDLRSIKWFLIAFASPDNEAIHIEQLTRAEARMSPDQLSEAESAAREWWRNHGSREVAYPRN